MTAHPIPRVERALRLLAMAWMGPVWLWGLPVHADVVARGSTPTQVTTGAGGQALIRPAAPQTGVSYNAFSQFDVNRAGAQFQNAEVGARTIVAEVFSPVASRIEGPVSVDGPRANLILANQNGLVVNGASFVNFGSLALTTGAVRLRDEQVAPDVHQRYVDVVTGQGRIDIGAAGLDVNVIRLELIARQVGIGGNITNAYSSPTALTRVVSGASTARFDTVASPTDNLTPWVRYEAGKGSAVSAIAIDVTAGSTVTSGRIEVLVTDQGAGVRNAGRFTANASDFVLDASGQVEQLGGEIQALGNVRLKAGALLQSSRSNTASLIAAGGSTRIDVAGDFRNEGGTVRGAARDPLDTDTPYAVLIQAGGELVHRTAPGGAGAVVFGSGDDVGLVAGADITLQNARVVSNAQLRVQTAGALRVESLLNAGTGLRDWKTSGLLSSKSGYEVDLGALADAEHQAYLVSDTALVLQARSIDNIGGHVFSNHGSVTLQASDTITTQALATGGYTYTKSCFVFLCRRNANSTEALVGGQIQAGTDVRLQAGRSILNDGGSVFSIGTMTLEAPEITARGQTLHSTILRADGLKALLGDTWAGLYAMDQGGSFTAQQGRLLLRGQGRQDRGTFTAVQGVDGSIDVIQVPGRTPVTLDKHIGLLSW